MRNTAVQKPDTGTDILDIAEALFAERGFSAVSLREIARQAGVVVSNVTYHHGDKLGILTAIYQRRAVPMNARRAELLGEARRINDRSDRLTAILRAYLLPTLSASDDPASGGIQFTRMRALMSVEGDPVARQLIAGTWDETSRRFINAVAECLPEVSRTAIVWRLHFLLGALYFTMLNPDRLRRLSGGEAVVDDPEATVAELAGAAHASLMALCPQAVVSPA